MVQLDFELVFFIHPLGILRSRVSLLGEKGEITGQHKTYSWTIDGMSDLCKINLVVTLLVAQAIFVAIRLPI